MPGYTPKHYKPTTTRLQPILNSYQHVTWIGWCLNRGLARSMHGFVLESALDRNHGRGGDCQSGHGSCGNHNRPKQHHSRVEAQRKS